LTRGFPASPLVGNAGSDVSVKDYATSGGAQTQEVDYTYDTLNRLISRVLKTNYSGGTPGTVKTAEFVYDGNNMMLAFDGTGALTERSSVKTTRYRRKANS
jgi:hypothetical protein